MIREKNSDLNKKNKAIVLLGLNGRGGTLQYASSISSALAKNTKVTLLLPSYSDTSLISKNVKLIRLNAPPNALKTMFLTLNIFEHINVIKKINSNNPDIINILDIHPWYLMYWPFLKGKKYVTINDPKPHSGEAGFVTMCMIKTVTKFLLKNADKIIVLGKKQADVIKEMGYKQEVIVSRIGSYDFFTKKSDKKYPLEKNTILFFGRIKDYKGLKYLLEALIKIKDKEKFKLIIAGEGDITPYAVQLKKLEKDVEVLNGYVSDDKVNEYFQRAAFIVMPYTDATQTGVVQVAYAFKKPVIATNVGSLPEIVLNRKTGIIIEPKNVKQLMDSVKELLNNPKKTIQLGIEANNFLKKEYDWDIIAKKLYEEAYK